MQTNGGLSGKNSRAAKPRFAFAIAVLSRADNRLIGYQLHPNYWNKSLATEAAQAVRDHAFRDLDLSRVISLIHPENAASRRVP